MFYFLYSKKKTRKRKLEKEEIKECILTDYRFVIVLTIVMLVIGVLGFHIFEKQDWITSFYDASCILSIVGAGDDPKTPEGKIFGALYTLSIGLGYIFLLTFVILSALEKYSNECNDNSSKERKNMKK